MILTDRVCSSITHLPRETTKIREKEKEKEKRKRKREKTERKRGKEKKPWKERQEGSITS